MAGSEFDLMVRGYGLTTAEIHYRLSDHFGAPTLCLARIRCRADLSDPADVLDCWRKEIEGPLHSVRVAHHRLIPPAEWRAIDGVIHLY